MSQHLVTALLALCPAADPPAKEPAYAGKPAYCRLAFGRERAVVWLALDGDKLYADRNGNGDLTDDGPPATAEVAGTGETAWRNYRVPELRVGGRTHRDLWLTVAALKASGHDNPHVAELLAKQPGARSYRLGLDVAVPGRAGSGIDGRVRYEAGDYDAFGVLQFSQRPQDAPLVAFDGPLTLGLASPARLTVGRNADLMLFVACRGEGPGTTSAMNYEGVVPEGVCPVVDATLPPREPGGPPVRERYELKQRC